VLDLILSCIGPDSQRLSAKEITEHPFLAMEPEVILLSTEAKSMLKMEVVCKGHENLSVKFDFNGTRI
jgi:hypothetical protein